MGRLGRLGNSGVDFFFRIFLRPIGPIGQLRPLRNSGIDFFLKVLKVLKVLILKVLKVLRVLTPIGPIGPNGPISQRSPLSNTLPPLVTTLPRYSVTRKAHHAIVQPEHAPIYEALNPHLRRVLLDA